VAVDWVHVTYDGDEMGKEASIPVKFGEFLS